MGIFSSKRREALAQPYIVKGKRKTTLLSEAGNGRKPIGETNRITLSVPHLLAELRC